MNPPRSVPDLDSPLGIALAVGALVAGTATLYAADVFATSGGIVWIPFDAALVGFVAAVVVGYRDRRLVTGILVAYAPFLGFRLEWALFGLSARPFLARLAYFVRPDGLAMLGVEALVVGTVGYGVGRIVRLVAAGVREPVSTD